MDNQPVSRVIPRTSRERLPVSKQFSREEVKALSNRFFAMRSKALARDLPFAWEKFTPFMKDLEELFPGRAASEIRLKFGLGDPRGYCKETLIVSKAPSREKAEQKVTPLSAEIAVLLTTDTCEDGEMRPLSETAEIAAANL